MRRWETLTALAAVALASLGSIRFIPGHTALTIVAVVLIATVGVSRLMRALAKKNERPASSFDPAQRARMIRERRGKPR